jgi:hypothetical protein
MTGEALFGQIGCADCHRPQYITGTVADAVLSNRTIQPYSDFLLHNMGTLSDGIGQGDAPGTHMRTAPLWGLRVRDPLLHDGTVGGGTFEELIRNAIARHGLPGSEASNATTAFGELSLSEQAAVIAFLDSLGRAEFDHDGNDAIDEDDFLAFRACFDAAAAYTPDDACSLSDIEQDGDVDEEDFQLFLTAFDGPLPDCDGNSVVDYEEMILEGAADCNNNAVLDLCDAFVCNDDNACTDDACGGTVCQFTANAADCDDGNGCTVNDSCKASACLGTAVVVLYGDIIPLEGVDLDDILCTLDGFANPGDCSGGDIAPCGGNGKIDLDDILAVLDAFSGIYACPHPCPPP